MLLCWMRSLAAALQLEIYWVYSIRSFYLPFFIIKSESGQCCVLAKAIAFDRTARGSQGEKSNVPQYACTLQILHAVRVHH
ncbi:hypothetical protein EAE89_10665 [Photorhabdus heterorhabditis]|uniref:Secreted protein n=1 Tax=Photorhabdus heterorhabditis TaxID=880156 RepID=A0ABR5KES2_9GAMM|nr:hypothetical protein AM629_05105 [Photorhabdus heterorhabditis]MBS9442147.1 hypothetical protein [Photorhabdus heterorhabditis]